MSQAQSPAFHLTGMLLGVTGGIGSGKSTAARLFTEFGFELVDSDRLVREAVLKDGKVVEQIATHHGKDVLNLHGEIDRGALAKRVFSDPNELNWLESVVHPPLFEIWRKIIRERQEMCLVFEVPLLFEKGLENWFDFTICVATSSSNQLARLAERGMSHALAEQRISKQLPLAQKLELADIVLSNDGSPEFLREQIATLVSQLAARR